MLLQLSEKVESFESVCVGGSDSKYQSGQNSVISPFITNDKC